MHTDNHGLIVYLCYFFLPEIEEKQVVHVSHFFLQSFTPQVLPACGVCSNYWISFAPGSPAVVLLIMGRIIEIRKETTELSNLHANSCTFRVKPSIEKACGLYIACQLREQPAGSARTNTFFLALTDLLMNLNHNMGCKRLRSANSRKFTAEYKYRNPPKEKFIFALGDRQPVPLKRIR